MCAAAKQREKRYWLFKSEPSCYSIDDLAAEPTKTTFWDGVRNYQARNMLRDDIQVGDRVFFYHSNAKPMAIVGTTRVVKSGYPDDTAFDPKEDHYDPKSDPESPRWFMVDIKLIKKFSAPITREMIKEHPVASQMTLMQRGSRLSVQPVTLEQWEAIHELAGLKP